MDRIIEYKQVIKWLEAKNKELINYNVPEDTKNRIAYNKELIKTYEQEILEIQALRRRAL